MAPGARVCFPDGGGGDLGPEASKEFEDNLGAYLQMGTSQTGSMNQTNRAHQQRSGLLVVSSKPKDRGSTMPFLTDRDMFGAV